MMNPVTALTTIGDHVSFKEGWITPLRDTIDGVTRAEAVWRPAPDTRSIADIVAHLISWTEWAVSFLDGIDTDVTDWPVVELTTEDDWKALAGRMNAALASFQERIMATEPGTLFHAPTPGATDTNRFVGIGSILVHNAYHAGQITKLREAFEVAS